jgi:uncharacterized membrane protein YgcG
MFGIFAIVVFVSVPVFFLARTAFVLVPVALAGVVWGYRRRPLDGVSGSGSSSGWDWSVSSGSSGSDSGSSSDSGDSGGGGSSGGGGASGSW